MDPQLSGTSTAVPNAPPLLSFANTLDQAVNLARKKRNAGGLDLMKPHRGVATASDFSSILSNMNAASDSTATDLIKRATEADTPTFDTLSDATGALYQVQKDSTGRIIGQPQLLFPGAPAGSGSGTNNMMTDNERALFSQFRGEPIVKDYNVMLQKKLSVDGIVKAGIGGPGDLALVYEFMKGLDPTSVVRETEYASAAKSGNIFAGALAQFNGYFKPNGGFLPPQVQQAFQTIVNSKFDVQRGLYENVAEQYRQIAQRQNLNPDNVVIGYDKAAPAAVSKGQLSDRDYVETALRSQGINYDDVTARTPQGKIAVVVNASGEVGYITPDEFNSATYTKL